MKKTLRISTGHNLCVMSVDAAELPVLPAAENYTKFYVVRTWNEEGPIMMYLAKGHPNAPGQIVAWYKNTKAMWSSYGTNFENAIEGAIAAAWLYA